MSLCNVEGICHISVAIIDMASEILTVNFLRLTGRGVNYLPKYLLLLLLILLQASLLLLVQPLLIVVIIINNMALTVGTLLMVVLYLYSFFLSFCFLLLFL